MVPAIATPAAPGLVAGRFAIDFTLRLQEGAGGHTAFAVQGSASPPLMAIQVERGWPARARALQDLTGAGILNLLTPLGHGSATLPSGEAGYFVVTIAAPGRPIATMPQPWPETDLINRLIRPASAVLRDLEQRSLTHRAIRPDNVFAGLSAEPVTLGSAWAAPPAALQPPSSEPPYVAVCDPAGRGEGSIADDVYALGVIMIHMALGRDPLAGLEAEAIIQRKLDLGSYAAIVGQSRLPSFIADLARGMLSDDPEHRPSPTLLGDPAAARARRTAARAPRRSPRAIEIGGMAVTTPRMLAHAILRNPAQCLAPLRTGVIDHWIRRGVGDADLAARLDDAIAVPASRKTGESRQADAVLLMQSVAVLDPLAPLVWQGAVFWPDGLGAALNCAMQGISGTANMEALMEAARSEIIEVWANLRPGRPDQAHARGLVRSFHKWTNLKPSDGAAMRLGFALNPLAPCESPLVPRSWVTRLGELLPAMEAAVASRRGPALLDGAVTAFITVRRDDRVDPAIGRALGSMKTGDSFSSLRVLAAVQAAATAGPLPHLANWMADGVTAIIAKFHSQSRRQRLTARLTAAVSAGDLLAMVNVIENPAEIEADAIGRANAIARIGAIGQLLDALEGGLPGRKQAAMRVGHDIACGMGMLACGIAVAAAILF